MLVATSTDAENDYEVTFPASGSICDYLVPGALQDGYADLGLVAKLIDKLGNESTHGIEMVLLDQEAACAFIRNPAPNSYVRGWVELKADAIDDDEVYQITYEYRAVGSADWITIAITEPDCGDPWNEDIHGNTIYWKTELLEDGAYELRAVARDVNLAICSEPHVITVTVDNTVPVVESFNMAPKYVTEATLPEAPSVWIGGSYVELFASASDENGIHHVTFYFKPIEDSFDSRTEIATDYDAPFAYMWDNNQFVSLESGWYDIIVEVVDLAGNTSWYTETVYIEHCNPYAEIIQINHDSTPDGSRFFGVITINAFAEDGSRMVNCEFVNQEWHCGLASLQFQYALGGGSGSSQSVPTLPWHDLGELLVGAGPQYSIDWDVSHLVGETVYIRAKVKDNVGNIGYSDEVMIEVIDKIAPKAVIAGVDPTFSYVWAVAETHGQMEHLTVRFEYKPYDLGFESSEWTVIGEVDTAYSTGVYGVPWHIGPMSGDYWVRAVAYDDDYDPEDPDFADLYDQDPAMMRVTIADGIVTMGSSAAITDLSLLGNLEDCEDIMVKAICEDKPTVIVVFDRDPEDHFNEPYVERLLMLERPDDPTCWVDYFSLHDLDPWGNAFVMATHNDGGIVGAVTEQFKLFKVTANEGTKGVVSQYGLAIDIPAGAVNFNNDGLIIVPVPKLIEDASVEPAVTVGDPIMVTFMHYYCGAQYTFYNGNRATVTMTYDESLLPGGVTEDDLLVAKWNEYGRYWDFSSLQNFEFDQEANTITFTTRTTGTFSVVAITTFRISDLVVLPTCGEYTGIAPSLCVLIEDLLTGIDEGEIKVVLNGPAENPVFDNVIIWNGSGAYGVTGGYDNVSHVLCMKIPEGQWYEWDLLGAGPDWDGNGLPAGTYTLDVWAMNNAGMIKHSQFTFKVDRTAPVVDFKGEYVALNPSFEVKITDTESGIMCDSIYLDIFREQVCDSCDYFEHYMGTLTPISCDRETGIVKFGNMVFDKTIGHEMAIDVVLYDGNYIARDYYGCAYGNCRQYENNHGVGDCAGNHGAPIWRRYIVDAIPPELELVSEVGVGPVKIQITDRTSGIDTTSFEVSGGEYGLSWVTTEQVGDRVTAGILTITTGQSIGKIYVSAADMVGNKSVLPIDLDRKAPRVAFTGSYVSPNPSFVVTITDDQNCVVCDSMYADIYESCPGCEATGKHLGRLTPVTCNDAGGNVLFGGLTLHLANEAQIDVVVDGVYDCSGNKAVPVWRRYIVDAIPPALEVVSEPNAKTLEIKVSDDVSGIDPTGFVVSSEGEYEKTWMVTQKIGERVTEGILKIRLTTPGSVDITAADMVGNTATITVKQGTTELVDLIDVVNYPNPFDPSNGECATIEYTLTKGAYLSIVIYDFSGEKVQTIYDGYRGPGTWTDTWCGYNGSGRMVASGAYIGFIKVDDGTKVVTKNLKIGVYKAGVSSVGGKE
ncbi:MAG: hypothetical protein ACUVUU_08860 [bacterium]